MINNFLKQKERQSPARALTPSKKSSQHHQKIDTFDNYFQDVMSRQHNPYTIIDSPHLNQRINDITATFNDQYLSAISTPSIKVLKRIERKKYITIKQKISQAVEAFQKSSVNSLKDLFEYKQLLLNEFLNEFTDQIEKQCKQKGQILKYIWNSMFTMIEHISQQLTKQLKHKQSQQLKNNIHQHQTYQNLIENYKQKQINLSQKYNLQKLTINKLVYQLRFKRKEINKLYRNQKILLNKVNQFKNSNLDLQSNYIDLISSLKDLPHSSVQQMLKAKQEINRNKQIRLTVKGNKKHNRQQITKQLSNDRTQDLNQLLQEIKDIATNKNSTPNLIGTLIQAAIENYGITNDDVNSQDSNLIQVRQKIPTFDASTQVSQDAFKNPNKFDQCTQFGYFDKLDAEITNNKNTQTYGEFGKRKILIDRSVNTSADDVRKKYVDWHFGIFRVYEEAFIYRREEEPILRMTPFKLDRTHKKHMSDLNFIESKYFQLNQRNSVKRDSESSAHEDSQDNQSVQKEQKMQDFAPQIRKKQRKLRKVTNASHGNLPSFSRRGDQMKSTQKQENQNQRQKKFELRASGASTPGTSYSRFRPKELKQQKQQKQKKLMTIDQLRQSKSSFSRPKPHRNTGTSSTPNHYTRIRSDFAKTHFLQRNCFSITIDQKKQNDINNFFRKDYQNDLNNCFFDLEEEEFEDTERLHDNKDIESEVMGLTLNHIDNLPNNPNLPMRYHKKKQSTTPKQNAIDPRVSFQVIYNDENDLLLNVCRSKYSKKSKKLRQRSTLFKYRQQFVSVKDNIQMISKDVNQLLINKQVLLRKVVNSKNLKNMYKILMMTFAKAYDCYNKGLVMNNLVYPLFESLSLIYGAINTTEIYKKMINFIACLSIKSQNTILRFFLFFLGLDRKSPYSEHVTISQVYLCLALLQKISIEGKITLNIESIYTDTTKIKEQLISVLKEEKIPSQLSATVKKRVDQQLQNSKTLRCSEDQNTHFRINIYNIIILIIQEVIKAKNKLKQSFIPIFNHCVQYQQSKRLPIVLIESVLSLCQSKKQDQQKVVNALKKNSKTPTINAEQFCSILFDNNLMGLDQLLEENNFLRSKWKVPIQFSVLVRQKATKNQLSILEKFQMQLYLKMEAGCSGTSWEEKANLQGMKKFIFTKYYLATVHQLTSHILGNQINSLLTVRPS